jgi:ribosome maturation factor RimP
VGFRARLFCYLDFDDVKRRDEPKRRDETKPRDSAKRREGPQQREVERRAAAPVPPAEIAAPLLARVSGLLEAPIEALGYALVRVSASGGRRPVLQIMIERLDGANITVEDCAHVSENVSALLDVEDVVPGAYTLEVSSPGIDRPLTKPQDYARFAGFEAKLELAAPLAGRKRFSARLCGLEGGEAIVDVEGEKLRLPFGQIAKAKLVLTDALIDATREGLIPPPGMAVANGAGEPVH